MYGIVSMQLLSLAHKRIMFIAVLMNSQPFILHTRFITIFTSDHNDYRFTLIMSSSAMADTQHELSNFKGVGPEAKF